LKVVILNNDFRVYWKGRLQYLQKFLSSNDIDFYAIELFGEGSPYSFDNYENSEGWWRCVFPNKSSDELSKATIEEVLSSTLDEIKPDIIIASSIVFYAGALGIRWAKKNKSKFIMFDDAKPSQVKRKRIVQWVKNSITDQVDGLWFPSKDYYSAYAHFHNKGICFFYGLNAIDNELFRVEGRKDFNNNKIICVARLVPIKNLDNLLRSWQLVEQRKTGYKLVIIGDGPEYPHLNQLKADLNLNTVEFLGAVDHDAIPEYYYKADAFVLASFSESWGLVVNEAMAAGLPVLLSNNINASHDLLKERVNGFGFNPLSVEDMACALLKYVDLDIESKQSMSANSLAIINSMSYEKMGEQLFEALNIIKNQKIKKPGIVAMSLINLWSGQYNKSRWDKLPS
jgi:glycosyltransferase involved in cell wall biosynthesis